MGGGVIKNSITEHLGSLIGLGKRPLRVIECLNKQRNGNVNGARIRGLTATK